MTEPVCYRCMMLSVAEPGDLCRRCEQGWESPYKPGPKAESLEDWSLERLIETQEAGDVPGQWRWEDHETPIGLRIANHSVQN